MKRFTIQHSMIGRLMLLLIMMANSLRSSAIPAYPGLISRVQPDGTVIQFELLGDEHFHLAMTTDGYLLEEDSRGALCYAQIDENCQRTNSLTLAHNVERRGDKEWLLLKGIAKPDLQLLNRLYTQQRMKAAQQKAPSNPFPTRGNVKGLILLVEFADNSFYEEHTREEYQKMMNEQGYSGFESTGSARDYFIDQSSGVFTPDFDVVGPIKLSKKMIEYGRNDMWGNDLHPDSAIIEACIAAKEELGINFADYDYNDDGDVDFVFMIYAGYGENQGASAATIWPHKGSLSIFNSALTIDGKRIKEYACTCELLKTSGHEIEGIGTFCHEFSHVLGLRDAYNTVDSSKKQLGKWDLMERGSYLNNSRTPCSYSAFERYSIGWLNLTDIDTPAEMELPELNSSNTAYRIRTDRPNEFFTLENRQQQGWDAYHPGKGLMIMHIDFDEEAWSTNTVNNGSHPRYDLVEADGSQGTSRATNLYPTADNNAFTDYTTPNALSWEGVATGKAVTNIRDDNGTIRFSFMKDQLPRPVILEATEIEDSCFTARWEAVENAVCYQLDIWESIPDSLNPIVATEDFNQFASSSYPSGGITDVSNQLDDYMQLKGWTGDEIYEAGGYARLGYYRTSGWLQHEFDLSNHDGRFTIAIRAIAPIGKDVDLTISATDAEDQSKKESIIITTTPTEQEFVLHFHKGAKKTLLRLASDNERLFLNDLKILRDSVDADQAWTLENKAWSLYDIPTNSCRIDHLEPNKCYGYQVTAFGPEGIRPSITSVPAYITTTDKSTGICQPSIETAEDVSYTYYTIYGHRIDGNHQGLCIRKSIDKYGNVRVEKVIR